MENIATETKNLEINDSTLRDGEQTAGIVFSEEEKLHIAKTLDEIGVGEIEAGVPAMGGSEIKAIRLINEAKLKAKIIGWNRAVTEDIYTSLDIGLKFIHVSVPASKIHMKYKVKKDFHEIKRGLVKILKILSKQGVSYSVGGEDSSRSDIGSVIELIKIAEGEGAYKFRYSDTVGILNPIDTINKINRLKSAPECDNIKLEIHVHNDFGMATANSVAALKAGADFLSGTIGGIGERAGNCPLEEVIAYFNFIEERGIKFDFIKAKNLAQYIAKITKRPIYKSKPIFGKNIFYHEAGIHTDGIIKYSPNYEAYSPDLVKAKRKFLFGKHSGSSALRKKMEEIGASLNPEKEKKFLESVRAESVKLKRSLTNTELKAVCLGFK